jgi:DNA-binding transcriptional ArsR family regulator
VTKATTYPTGEAVDLKKPASRPDEAEVPTADNGGALDEIFAALSDPIRRGIIAQLTRGPCSVTQLGMPFDVSAPAISRHLNVLERSGLIERRKRGRVHYCRLVPQPLTDAEGWIEQQKAFWERQFDALADYLDRESKS